MAVSLTIASFNCRGLSRVAKQNGVIELARARKVDILVLQETFVCRLSQIKTFDATFHTRSYWSFGASGSRGVTIVMFISISKSISFCISCVSADLVFLLLLYDRFFVHPY